MSDDDGVEQSKPLVPKRLNPDGLSRKSSNVHIDITIEKNKDRKGNVKFGRKFIRLSGSLAKRAIIDTDQKIRLFLPDSAGVCTLNLIYDTDGKPAVPDDQINGGVYSLLTDQRPELVTSHPVTGSDVQEVVTELKAGRFDLIATAIDCGSSREFDQVRDRVSVSDLQQVSRQDLQLIRVWDTGKFYTYNQATRKLNKLEEKKSNKRQRLVDGDVTSFRLIPGDESWNYSLNETSSFYRRYLIQDGIERQFPKSKETPKFHSNTQRSLPEITRLPPLPRRQKSFTSDYTFKGATPLQRRFSERPEKSQLTRQNLLRHEAVQRSGLLYPSRDNYFADGLEMDRHKGFDADDALTEQNLKCPVCKNFYDTRDRNPHILHCLHSCCNSCLKARVRGELAQCPVCSEVQEVPNNEIDLLPVDHARQHLVKYFKVRNRAQEIGCDSCDPRNRATHRCRECDEFLCGVCTEAHKRTKVTKSHSVGVVDNLKRSTLDEFHHKRTCPVPEHDDQHFSFYCYSKDCDQPICSLCAVTEHSKADGHDIRNINDVYVENKRLVESLMIDVKHKKNLSEEAIQSIEDEIQNLYIKENNTDEEIDQAFLACQKQLEKRKNELKEKLAATSKAKKKGMESQLDKLINERNSLDHAAKFANNVLGYSDATEFLQMKEALFARLGELKGTEIDTRPHNKADVKFHGHKVMEAFQKFTTNLGEVWSTTAFIPNTKIQTYDVGLGREETAMLITLHDYERRPLAEPGVDIRVEVTNPVGKKSRAPVLDMTETEGSYKVLFQGHKMGDHRASVFVMGIPVIDPGVVFKVRRPGALEDDVIRDYEPGSNPSHMAHVKSKIDTGQHGQLDRADDENDVGKKICRLTDVVVNDRWSLNTGLHGQLEQADDEKDGGVGMKERTVKDRGQRSYRVFGDIICPDFMLDGSSCHPQNMVTSDSRTLKNVRGRTAHIGTAFKNYRGALGTKPFNKAGRFYFEVVVYFFIKRQLRNDLIFEVALARRGEIDKNYTVDGSPFAWTVCARRCPLCRTVCLMAFHNGGRLYHIPCPLCRTVCLMAFHNGVRLYHNPLTENSPPGTTLRSTIGFLVDMQTKQWFIVDAKNRRLFFRFKSLDASKPLWPVFGAYSTEYVSVSLALKTGKDIQAVPDIPADA